MKLVGLDIGTTSICGIVLDSDTGRVLAREVKMNSTKRVPRDEWASLQDPTRILHNIEVILDNLLQSHPEVSGVGVTGQMHGILYVDSHGEAVSPLYTWQDGRGGLPYPNADLTKSPGQPGWEAQIPSQSPTYTEVLSQLTGYPLATGLGMVTHFYHVVNRSVPPEASCLCTIGDYIAMKIAGNTRPLTDITNAAGMGLFHQSQTGFDVQACEKAGINLTLLPTIVESGTVIGRTQRDIPVFVALGDNQSSFLGSISSLSNSLLVNIGTGGQISIFSPQPQQLPDWETRPFSGGGYLLVGAALSAGKSYELLERFFRQVCTLFMEEAPASLYNKMAKAVQGAHEVTEPLEVKPWFFGTRKNPNVRGSIEGISATNFTPEHLITGTLSGIADELWSFYKQLPTDLISSTKVLIASGNGTRKNPYLLKNIQERFKLPVRVPKNEEEAAVGAALAAAVGLGCFSSFAEAGTIVEYL